MQQPGSQWDEWEDEESWQEYEGASSQWAQDGENSQHQDASQAWQQSQENQQPRHSANRAHPDERPEERRVSWETQDDSPSTLEPPTQGDETSQLSDISSKEGTKESSWHTQEEVTKQPQPLYSPLAGVIRRGSIGGTGERGQNYSMVPPTIEENVPFMGKIGGGKVPIVELIRRGSISGIGERGYAVSYIGSEENEHKSESEKGNMGLHDPRLREKDKKEQRHMKKKVPPSFSGSKYGKGGSSYYLSKFGKKTPVSTSKYEAIGLGKGQSTVGSTMSTAPIVPKEKSAAKGGIEVVKTSAAGAPRSSISRRRSSSTGGRMSRMSMVGSVRTSIASHRASTASHRASTVSHGVSSHSTSASKQS